MRCRKCKAIKPKEQMKMTSGRDAKGRFEIQWECNDCDEAPKEKP